MPNYDKVLIEGCVTINTIELILKRKSVRSYSDKKISKENIDIILRAGLSSPSARNMMPWHFIVVEDNEIIKKMAEVNGKAGIPLANAPLVILVCMDMSKALDNAPNYAIIDCALAEENMVLAALSLGIGSCYFGTWPQDYKIEGQKKLFNLPDHIIPHMILSFGYPKDSLYKEAYKEIDLKDVEYY